jgi:DNA mismatch repair ATPase MutS
VFAKSMTTSFRPVWTALEIADDLLAGKSRYLAQAERLLAARRASDTEPALVLVDEIWSGTNSSDRISASIALLKSWQSTAALVVASTHDRAIAEALADYQSWHFTETLGSSGLEFDYRLYPGIVDHANALRLLQHLGFGKYLGIS